MDRLKACNYCGGSSFKLLFQKDQYSILRCKKCSLALASPQMSLPEISEFYSGGIERWTTLSQYTQLKSKVFNRHISLVNRYSKGRMLDVGCGVGFFLHLAKDAGWDVSGIDISKNDVGIARDVYNLANVECVDITDYRASGQYFDVITMWDFIEHIINPIDVMKRCNFFLKQKGLVFIYTGNIGSIFARIKRDKWEFIKPDGGHYLYFSFRSLVNLLKECGFETRAFYPVNLLNFQNREYSHIHSLRSKIQEKVMSSFLYSCFIAQSFYIVGEKVRDVTRC